jgi:hypothetical protein
MALHPLWSTARIAVLLAIGAVPVTVHGQVYKCTDGTGTTTYSDLPCTRDSKPLEIPGAATSAATDPAMCAQLRDELNRLATGENTGTRPSKRGTSLQKQYESRCVGISRTAPEKQ